MHLNLFISDLIKTDNMAKSKKKNEEHLSIHNAIKPYIKHNRVLYSILGGMGAGFILATIMGTEKSKALLDKITATVTEFGQHKSVAEKKIKANKKLKRAKKLKPAKLPKPGKPGKLFSMEES